MVIQIITPKLLERFFSFFSSLIGEYIKCKNETFSALYLLTYVCITNAKNYSALGFPFFFFFFSFFLINEPLVVS